MATLLAPPRRPPPTGAGRSSSPPGWPCWSCSSASPPPSPSRCRDNFTDPRHPLGEGCGPPGRAVPRRQRAPSTRRTSTSWSQAPEGDDPDRGAENAQVVDELVATWRRCPQHARGPAARAARPGRGRPASSSWSSRPRANGGSVEQARADAAALSPLTEDGRTGLITFTWDVETPADVEPETLDALDDVMDDARDQGLTVEANGSGATAFTTPGGCLRAHRHRRRAAGPRADLRLAGRRGAADHHRAHRRGPSASPASPP